jgi:DNA-binding transcriptional LysR family regulator
VDGALDKLGLRRSIALTTPRFLTVPSLVARAPVLVTMQARLARRFAAELGLSLSPLPVELGEITISLLWHASYDHDPAHAWLREQVTELAAEL